MATIPPTIINAPKTIGRARTAPKTFMNKKIAIIMVNIPRMPGPQPAPVNALMSPKMPIINPSTAKKTIKKVPTRAVA